MLHSVLTPLFHFITGSEGTSEKRPVYRSVLHTERCQLSTRSVLCSLLGRNGKRWLGRSVFRQVKDAKDHGTGRQAELPANAIKSPVNLETNGP